MGEGFTVADTKLLGLTHSGTTMASMVFVQSPILLLSRHVTNATIGLIRWNIVIHAFIDGKTRLVVGIQANNNNRAATVLALFLDCISVHGTPSRVRGDHGTENVEVARWMEENQGSGRGSYIWGRLVRLYGT